MQARVNRDSAVKEEFGREFCIRGYHVYKDIWDTVVAASLLSITAFAIACDDRL